MEVGSGGLGEGTTVLILRKEAYPGNHFPRRVGRQGESAERSEVDKREKGSPPSTPARDLIIPIHSLNTILNSFLSRISNL